MASMTLEGDVRKSLLDRTDAEKVFRPWWDTVEDMLLNCLIALGFLTLPTAYVTGNPVECVLHPNLWNKTSLWSNPLGVGHLYQDEYEEESMGYPVGTVRITHWYVKRYCTEKFVSKFVFYFPYILLIVPLTLVLVDRIFIKTFAAGNKIKQFYELLVEDSLRREDVDSLSRENMKNLHEIMQSFRFSNVCYWSYLSRTFLEIILSIALFLIYFCWGMPNLEREIECDVHGLRHSCVLPNHQFYFYILAVSSILLCVYILCNLYNLVWIICPQLGTMYRIIRKYQIHVVAADSQNGNNLSDVKRKSVRSPPRISPDNFLNVYFDRRHKDLKLLLNLLAETSGLPESFRILTLFDKKFQSLWKPQNLRFEEYETVVPNQKIKSHSIIVRWNDAPISHFLANYQSSLSFEYTIDIHPAPANELGLKSVLYKKGPPGTRSQAKISQTCLSKSPSQHLHYMTASHASVSHASEHPNNVESFNLLETGMDPATGPARIVTGLSGSSSFNEAVKSFRYEVTFDNIVSDETEYTVTISTELNGRTVTQMVEKFPMGSPVPTHRPDVMANTSGSDIITDSIPTTTLSSQMETSQVDKTHSATH
ncbi:uncharacterized protein LOC131886258 isoform X2 [Tigriopus californicus]|uniref:uncharacterized protein LOC131886258 isoform X2 n=1 Tax=Tigriopus californicus TaxID=6832 RepID=UPI0027DA6BB8|nr:uncharacterized protein LOC131886258 isoform X2 [Tigriopus californicus]